MYIPTFAIFPPLLLAFGILAFEHWRSNPEHQVRDKRFLMMAGAIVIMIAQLLAGWRLPWLSVGFFLLALIWLGVAINMLRRRLAQG